MKIAIKRDMLHLKRPNTISLLMVYAMPNTIIVLFSPCTVSIGKFYNVDVNSLYYLSILALAGFAIGPLVSPLISMKYGKKASLIIGSSIALVSVLGTMFFTFITASYTGMLIFRLLSVVGASIALISVPAIINEYYHEFYARKMMFVISAIFCVWPGIVMGISGFIAHHIGWKFTEVFLLMYTISTYLMMFKLPETQKAFIKDKNIFKPYASSIKIALTNPKFILFTLMGGIMGVALYYFISETPFVALNYMKMSSSAYGYYSLILYICATIALLSANVFASKLNFKSAALIGISGSGFCSALMLILFLTGFINVFSVFVLTAGIIVSLSSSFGYGFAKAIAVCKEKSLGTSLFLFIYMLFSSAVPFVTKNFNRFAGVNIYPIVMILLSIVFIMLYSVYVITNRNSQIED